MAWSAEHRPSKAYEWFDAAAEVVGVSGLLRAWWWARENGTLNEERFRFLIVMSAIIATSWSAIDVIRSKWSFSVYRRPRAHLPQLAAMSVRAATWLAIALAANLAVVPLSLSVQRAHEFQLTIWGLSGLLVLTALAPRARRWAPSDLPFCALLLLVGFDLAKGMIEPAPGGVMLRNPFFQTALVLDGGASPLFNTYARSGQYAWTLGLLPLAPNGRLCTSETLAAFPCFGAYLGAPIGGKIAHVERERADMPIGRWDRDVPSGNSVSIQTQDGFFVILAHLKAGSILVNQGDEVAPGEPIARCGNSGVSNQPHLRLQVQNLPLPDAPVPELRTFPIRFIDAERVRGESTSAGPFSVRRNDLIRLLPSARSR